MMSESSPFYEPFIPKILAERGLLEDKLLACADLLEHIATHPEKAKQFFQAVLKEYTDAYGKNVYLAAIFGHLASRVHGFTLDQLAIFARFVYAHASANLEALDALAIDYGLVDCVLQILVEGIQREAFMVVVQDELMFQGVGSTQLNAYFPMQQVIQTIMLYSKREKFARGFIDKNGPQHLLNLVAMTFPIPIKHSCVMALALLLNRSVFVIQFNHDVVHVLMEMVPFPECPTQSAAAFVIERSVTIPLVATYESPANPSWTPADVCRHNSMLLMQYEATSILATQLPLIWNPNMPPSPTELKTLMDFLNALVALTAREEHVVAFRRLALGRFITDLMQRAFTLETVQLCAHVIRNVTSDVYAGTVLVDFIESTTVAEPVLCFLMQTLTLMIENGVEAISPGGGAVSHFLSAKAFERVLILTHSMSSQTSLAALQLLEASIRYQAEFFNRHQMAIVRSLCDLLQQLAEMNGPLWHWSAERDILLKLLGILHLVVEKGFDPQEVVRYINTGMVFAFLERKPWGVRTKCTRALQRIVHSAQRRDPRILEIAARKIQQMYRQYVPHSMLICETHMINLLSESLFERMQIEEEWYQSILRIKRHVLMKFE